MVTFLVLLLTAAAVLLWSGAGTSAQRLRSLQCPVRPVRQQTAPTTDGISQRFWSALPEPLTDRIRKQRTSDAIRQAAIELCDGLAAELTAGRPPEAALSKAIAVLPEPLATLLRPTTTAADIPASLDQASTAPGAESLRLVAACWRIGVERGTTFATITDSLATALRDETAHREHVVSQLAGPRTTARLLAVLPLIGIAMAWAMGANPLAFLFTTLPGLACLTTGLTLNATGILWTNHIAHSAENPT